MSAEHPDTDWLQLAFEFNCSEEVAASSPAFVAALPTVSATIYQLPRRPSMNSVEAHAIQRLLEKAEALSW